MQRDRQTGWKTSRQTGRQADRLEDKQTDMTVLRDTGEATEAGRQADK